MFPPPSRSSHPSSSCSRTPEVISLPLSSRTQSMDKIIESGEQEAYRIFPELHSVSSYNSLSSLSSCGSGQSNAEQSVDSEGSVTSKPRSIFKTYWEKSGSLPQTIRADKSSHSVATPATASVSSWDTDEESAANSYERVLKRNEGVKSRRRSIFGSQYQSMPSLDRPYHPGPLERKAKSSSELEKRKLSSCLRSGERNARSSSVSFDSEVSVITFSPPKENWAADGWSNYFY